MKDGYGFNCREASRRFIEIRTQAGMTQEQLAEKLGVSRQAISKWESGTAYPEMEKIIQCSRHRKRYQIKRNRWNENRNSFRNGKAVQCFRRLSPVHIRCRKPRPEYEKCR